MSINLANTQTFTDSDILTILRAALVNAAISKMYRINNRELEHMSAKDIQGLVAEYERRINTTDGQGLGFGTALANMSGTTNQGGPNWP